MKRVFLFFALVGLSVCVTAQTSIYSNSFANSTSVDNWTLSTGVTWDAGNGGQLIFPAAQWQAITPELPTAGFSNLEVTISAINGNYLYLYTSPDNLYFTNQGTFTGSNSLTTASRQLPDGTKYVRFFTNATTPASVYLVSVSIRGCSGDLLPIRGISLDKTSITMVQGQTVQLTATPVPYCSNREVRWYSSNKEAVTVSETGLVTAVKRGGTARITARSVEGAFTADCTVEVDCEGNTDKTTKLELHKRTTNIPMGTKEQLGVKIEPFCASKTLNWESSNKAVATVDATGWVTPVAEGTATITVSAKDVTEKYDRCTVYVKPADNVYQKGNYGSLYFVLTKDSILYLNGVGQTPDRCCKTPPATPLYLPGVGYIAHPAPICVLPSLPYDVNRVKNVVIGEGITRIGCNSFLSHSNLIEVTMPTTVTEIGWNAFYGCKFSRIKLGKNIEYFTGAFSGNPNLKVVELPDGTIIKYIGNETFSNCTALESITIPNGVENIGQSAFFNCKSLTTISSSNSIVSTEQNDIDSYSNLEGANFFPSSLVNIWQNAFDSCHSLEEITLTDSIANIGDYAFANCKSLTTVNFNAMNCTSMSTYAKPVFKNCPAFTTLNIGNKVKNIPEYAFNECSGLTSITIPENLVSVGDNAFANCSSLKTVNYNAVNCTMSRGDVGGYVYTVFFACDSLTTLNIGDKVKTISEYAFMTCKVTSVKIPNSVTDIALGAFFNCSKLETLTLGKSVASIGDYAFYGTQLTSITCLAKTPPVLESGAFYTVPSGIPVYIPCSSYDSYVNDPQWSYFTNFIATIMDTTYYDAVKCYNLPYTDDNFTTPLSAGTYYRSFNLGVCDSVACLRLTEKTPTASALKIVPTDSSFVITWNGNASLYHVYRDNSFLNTVNTAAYTDNNLTIGRNYCYKIKAVDGVCEGNFSDTICHTFNNVGIVGANGIRPEIRVYPNPAGNQLKIKNYELKEGEVVEIYSVVGQKLMQLPCRDVINHVSTIDISNLANGLYFLKINNQVTKFVKE